MTTTLRFALGSMLVLAVAGCGSEGSMGATTGGAQDNGLAQTQINRGQVPKPEAFTVEGLLNQYDLPLEEATCTQELCIDAAYGVAPILAENRGAVFVQLGFSSGINPATFRRSALNLSVVVDRSGSMAGSKLDSVKQALVRLVDQLTEADRLSIVLFDDRVDVLVEPTLVTNKPLLKSRIATITARNTTNMASALRQGSALVQANAGHPGVSDRVMVFTDANTNAGDTDQPAFIQIAAEDAAQNIGITMFGVGTDLNQELVLAITELRGGNYFFLQDAAKIATIFDTNFDYLVTPLAYDLQFQLLPAAGFLITSVYGYSAWRTGSTLVSFTVPTVFLSRNHGAIVVRLEPINRTWPVGASPLAGMSMTYQPADGRAKVTQTLDASYPGTPTLADDTIYYSQRAVRKTVALVNEALGEKQASQLYFGGSKDSALALLDQIQSMLRLESATLTDTDLSTEATVVTRLASNMRYSSPSSYSGGADQETPPMACNVAAGSGGTRSGLARVATLALAVVALGARKRRHRRP